MKRSRKEILQEWHEQIAAIRADLEAVMETDNVIPVTDGSWEVDPKYYQGYVDGMTRALTLLQGTAGRR